MIVLIINRNLVKHRKKSENNQTKILDKEFWLCLVIHQHVFTLQSMWIFSCPPVSIASLMCLNVTAILSLHRLKTSKFHFTESSDSTIISMSLIDNPNLIAVSLTSILLNINDKRRRCRSEGVTFKKSSFVTRMARLYVY